MVVENSKTSKIKDTNDSSSKGEQFKLAEQIKKANNILITVSRNPSVDALSAALGLTAIIDKMEKHGTAIFSGKAPHAIEFLNPDKIFEDTADSLRDFIIALSRDKADHLRYKVEGDVVKIYVTPYKTIITEKDLEFSQGDYNVELVIALGVGDQKDLDVALAAHGRILHDATVTTINVGEEVSSLGSINLQAKDASSLSEIVADISELLNKGSSDKLIDGQIATALMTGIVATTDRFSNERTSSRTMAVAASLMSAGADQQLIATQLEEAQEAKEELARVEESESVAETKGKPDGSLSISHDDEDKTTSSRLVIGAADSNDAKTDSGDESIHIPTATEILSQLAAVQESENNQDSQSSGADEEPHTDTVSANSGGELNTDDALAEALSQQVTASSSVQASGDIASSVASSESRVYLESQQDDNVISESSDVDDSMSDGRISSEQSPSVGAEPLRGASSVTTVVEPLNQIDPMAPPVVDPKPAQDDLPQFNVDQSAEAILQAALNSASPTAELTGPALPPPPPPPAPDFSTPPPALPDFSTLPPESVAPVSDTNNQPSGLPPINNAPVIDTMPPSIESVAPVEPVISSPTPSPVMSTLPPEDMILAGNQQLQPPSNDPSQFRIPGQ